MRERRDSSYWRTMSCPVLAVDFQWIWRRESPGGVLADRVERHVGVHQAAGRVALEIADQAGARRRDRRRARVDVELVHVVEGVLAPQQADRVAADRRRRTDRARCRAGGRGCPAAARPCGRAAAAERRTRRAPAPTGMSRRPGSAMRRPSLRTTISPVTLSPATTRSWARTRSTSYERAPKRNGTHMSQERARSRPRPSTPPSRTRSRCASPTVAATHDEHARRAAPCGRSTSAAAASAAPTARETRVHHTTARTMRRPPAAG